MHWARRKGYHLKREIKNSKGRDLGCLTMTVTMKGWL
jgi:hypothetical protein